MYRNGSDQWQLPCHANANCRPLNTYRAGLSKRAERHNCIILAAECHSPSLLAFDHSMLWTQARPFQALSLTGGGYRGLFTARALQVIESHIEVPIGRRFDLTSGTSIGGIVALAVAFEVPMSKVVEVFEEFGEAIFPPREPPTSKIGKGIDLWQYSRKPRYSTAPLREAIIKLIDKDATLNDASHAVAIPAVNVTQGKPQVFKTRHKA